MSETDKILGPMRGWVADQIAAGRFASAADAVQAALVTLAAHDASKANLQRLVQQGLADVAAGNVAEYESAEALARELFEPTT